MYIETERTIMKRPQAVGAKAYNLARLAGKFRVPEFAVVSTRAYQEYRARGMVPPRLQQAIEAALAGLLARGKVAVRSSCTAEDLPGVSFAGVYSTVLSVGSVAEGMAAVAEVWRSADAPRAAAYRAQVNAAAGNMAVMLQHQLTPETSGVMVTQSPFSVNEVMIECCPGLGERLVSGRITPSRYRVRDGRVIEQKGEDILAQEQVSELVKAGKKIERIFGSAQDIEWAYERGRFFILQSRPLFVQAAGRRKKGTVWCNANVRETIPDPVSPMNWSIFDGAFFPGIMIDVFGFPVSREKYEQYRPVEMLSGRLYWNMNNTLAYGKAIGPLLDLMSGDEAIDPQMAAAFRAVDIDDLPEILSRSRMIVFSLTALVRLLYYLSLGTVRYGWMRKKLDAVNGAIEVYCAAFEPSADLKSAVDKVTEMNRFIVTRFARKYFGGIMLGGFHLTLLSMLLSIRLGKKGEALARRSITGIMDKTGEMAISISGLALLAKRKLGAVNPGRLARLGRRDREFRTAVEKFMADFGHRGPAEFDIASRNWREDRAMLFRVITAAKDTVPYVHRRAAIVRDLLRSARPYERFVLKAFLPRLEASVPVRENGKHNYLKAAAKIKDQLLMTGRQLFDRGYLERPRDIFFLTLRDLEGIAAARLARREVRVLVRQRVRQWHEYARAEVPDIIYENGERVRARPAKAKILNGEPLSSGRVKARARVIDDFSKIGRLKQGEILVTHHADPGWTPLFTIASGVVIEVGGVICHAAMVARELGIPAVSVTGAVSLIPDGAAVELDADQGVVTIL